MTKVFQGESKSSGDAFGRFFFWGLALIWMAVIFAFSSQANSGAYTEAYLQEANVPVRKLAHMFEFAVLAVLYQMALARSITKADGQAKINFKHYWLAFVLAVLYALSDEWHQSFVPGRSSSLFDSGVDSIGALIGLTTVYWLRRLLVSAQEQEQKRERQ
jgi:VanZ family protein